MLKVNIQKIVLVLFIGLISFKGQSQMKQRVADRLYDELAYFKAVELYEDLASKSKATSYQIKRTGECYRELGDYKNAEIWYSKLVSGNDATADDYYNYAQTLKSTEKYKEANVQMEKFFEKASANTIAIAHSENKDYSNELKVHADRFEIEPLNEVNTKYSDFGASYYEMNGEKVLVFASSRRNMNALNKEFQSDGSHFLDLYTINLNDDGQGVSQDKFYKEVKSKYHEGPVSFSNKGAKMYLTRSNYLDKKKGLDSKSHNNLKLYLSEFENGVWGDLKEFKYNSDDYSVGHATVTEDGTTMYFISDMVQPIGGNANKNKGETDIWKSTRKSIDEEWGLPENVKSVNTEGKEMFPYIGKSGILYFASNGHVGLGGLDMYRAEPKDEGFGEPLNMGYPLNTNYDDFGFIVNDEETLGYISSNRLGIDSKGNDDIFKVKILYPFGPKLYKISGTAIDLATGEKLAGVDIKIVDTETEGIVKDGKTDDKGFYSLVGLPEGKYKIIGYKDDYSSVEPPLVINTDDIVGREMIDTDVNMKKNDCGLIGTVSDAETGESIEGVKITLTNKATGQSEELATDEKGQFKDPLTGIPCPGGTIDYKFVLEKEGCYPKEINFKYVITKAGIVNLNEFLKVNLISNNRVVEVSEICGLDDILFDFNKYDIRTDAAKTLDKLVSCLKENPGMRVEIGSHTDCRGSSSYNRRLSAKRAKASMKYVISKGISKDRILGKGYGADKLKNYCSCSKCSEEDHQENRRTEFNTIQ
jgi:outer membrane protein OmpA-like peptidoglycan-associated protein